MKKHEVRLSITVDLVVSENILSKIQTKKGMTDFLLKNAFRNNSRRIHKAKLEQVAPVHPEIFKWNLP